MNISNNHKRKGIALAWVAITIIMIVGIMALMLEGARIYITSHHLQNTADAAALAGARYVAVYHDPIYRSNPATNARDVAIYYASQNPVLGGRNIVLNPNMDNEPAGEIVLGRFITQYATDGDDSTIPFQPLTPTELLDPNSLPNALKVLDNMGNDSANAPLPMKLGKMFGGEPKHLSRYAIAKISGASGAAIIALSEDEVGILLRGNPTIAIENGGSIQVNSTLENALDINGEPLNPEDSLLSEINVVGEYEISDKVLEYLDTIYDGEAASITPDAEHMDDPYEGLAEPSPAVSPTAPADGSNLAINEGTHILEPGYYPGGLSITGGNITMNSGVYSFGAESKNTGGLSVTGGVTNALNVMLFIEDGSLDIRGNTQMTLTPPTSGTYKGISVFQSYSNLNDAEINGGGGLDLIGVLYFPENHLDIEGNSDTIGTQLIADTIEIHGNGLINIPYDGSPEVVTKSYLVE